MAMAHQHEPHFARVQREEREQQQREIAAAEAAQLAAEAPRFAEQRRQMDALRAKHAGNGNGHPPTTPTVSPLPKHGKRPKDGVDEEANAALDGQLGADVVDFALVKTQVAQCGRFSIPHSIFDQLLPTLEPAERWVFLYVARHTVGFQKEEDAISLKQFCKGITKKADGTVQDCGTGLGRRTVQRALHGLIAKHLVLCKPVTSDHGDPDTNVYRLAPGVWPK